MSTDFAYAQARAQARLGERLPEDGWRVLESSLGLAQYLASVRSTVLAPRIRHFSTAVTPHAIERTLRDEWRSEVADVTRWVPDEWSRAVGWAAWIPYISSVEWLLGNEPALAWMQDDPVLAELAIDDPGARRAAIGSSPFGTLIDDDRDTDLRARWFAHWQSLWPVMADEARSALHDLVDAVRAYLDAIAVQSKSLRDRREARARLTRRASGMMHRHIQQPAVVFCHLLLFGLELQRLRDGLMRRALFADAGERAA